jgi:hypothetical protein
MALQPQRSNMRIGKDAFARCAMAPTDAGTEHVIATMRVIARRWSG